MAQRRNLSIGITVNLDNYENLRLEMSGEICDEGDAEELITYLDTILSRLGRGTPETAQRVDSYRRRVFTRPIIPVATAGPGEAPSPSGSTPPVSVSAASPAMPASAPTPSPVGEKAALPPSLVKEPVTGKEPASPAVEKKSAASAGVSMVRRPISPGPASVPEKEVPEAGKRGITPPTAEKEPVSPPAKKGTISPSAMVRKETPTIPSKPSSAPGPSVSDEMRKEDAFSCERCGEPITPVQRKLSRMFQNKDLCKKCLQQL
jgi:hypothetical protein